jgi:hypothetical protein
LRSDFVLSDVVDEVVESKGASTRAASLEALKMPHGDLYVYVDKKGDAKLWR